eukprot:867289-Rhodomonas_salina.1
MRKGVCAAQPNHTFARQSTLFACLTRLPSGETASLERNLTYVVSQGRWPSYNSLLLVYTSGFLLHSLPCAQDLSVGEKTADLLGPTGFTGTLASLFLDDTFAGGLDSTFAGVLELTGAGLGWIHGGALTTATGRDSLWGFDNGHGGTLATCSCGGTIHSG